MALIETYLSLFTKAAAATVGFGKPQQAARKHVGPKGGGKGGGKRMSKEQAKATAAAAAAVEGRFLSALLTGLSRAFPYTATPEQRAAVEAKADLLFALVHGSPSFSTSLRALMVLQQVAASRAAPSSSPAAQQTPEAAAAAAAFSTRFYRALYAHVALDDLAAGASKHGLFLNLVYKAAKADAEEGRVRALLKRLLQV